MKKKDGCRALHVSGKMKGAELIVHLPEKKGRKVNSTSGNEKKKGVEQIVHLSKEKKRGIK